VNQKDEAKPPLTYQSTRLNIGRAHPNQGTGWFINSEGEDVIPENKIIGNGGFCVSVI
jgi:hypothetical protein